MNRDRIKEILDDSDFAALRQSLKDGWGKAILAAQTTDEVRAARLAELHALERVEAAMKQAIKGKN